MNLRGIFGKKTKNEAPPQKPAPEKKVVAKHPLEIFLEENVAKRKSRQERFASDYYMKHTRDLSPVVNAAIETARLLRNENKQADAEQAMKKLSILLISGCSILWRDENTRETVIKTLAHRGEWDAIAILLQIESKRLALPGNYQNYHNKRFRQILAEVIQGVTEIDPEAGQQHIMRICDKYIRLDANHPEHDDRESFININLNIPHCDQYEKQYLNNIHDNPKFNITKPLRNLIAGKHIAIAMRILNAALAKHHGGVFDDSSFRYAETMLLAAAPIMDSAEFNDFAQKLKAYCQSDSLKEQFKNAFNIAAAAGKHAMFVRQLTRIEDSGIALQRIENALCEAAKNGHAELTLDLCDELKNNSAFASSDVFKFISRAAAYAMASEHYALARALLHRTPVFSTLMSDVQIEFREWNAAQIKQLFLHIKNPRFCVEIAARLDKDRIDYKIGGLLVEQNLWKKQLVVFKKMYGLDALSDEGFLEIISHPETIQWLTNTTNTNQALKTNTVDVHHLPVDILRLIALRIDTDSARLSGNDLNIIRTMLNNKDTPERILLHHLIAPFYQKPRASEEGFKCYREIRKNVIDMLEPLRVAAGKGAKTNEISKLIDTIKQADTLQKIYYHLQLISHYSQDKPLVSAVDKCLLLFKSDQYKKQPDVVYAVNKWDEYIASSPKKN